MRTNTLPYKDKAQQREYQNRWMQERHNRWLEENGPCVKCGSSDDLQVDHRDALGKVNHRVWSWSDVRRYAELAKCQVLCRECHEEKSLRDIALLAEHSGLYEKMRIRSPEGMAWCNGDGHFAAIGEFTRNRAKRNGLENECKECRRIRRTN